jgi:pyruvate formate lyase activating enzyme
MSDDTLLVTDIQRYAVNDGPGFRTNVFLKGCSLRCAWCHNPETINKEREVYWKRRLCVQCGACLNACPRDAINAPIPPEEAQSEGSTYQKIIRERCDLCMKCVDACQFGALEIVGKPMTTESILDEVEQDRPFYDRTGGGMTVSGGEPTAHPAFTGKLLDDARKRGLHVCIDTSGFCTWETLKSLVEKVDIVLYDIKHIDSSEHERMCGAGNELILDNLRKLLELTDKEVWIRMPILEGFNDSIDYHKRAIEFLKSLPRKPARIDLLPFHNWCENKYDWLGTNWPLRNIQALEPLRLEIMKDLYEANDFVATVGGSGFENREGL